MKERNAKKNPTPGTDVLINLLRSWMWDVMNIIKCKKNLKKISFFAHFFYLLNANNSKFENRKNLRYDFSFVSAHCSSFM